MRSYKMLISLSLSISLLACSSTSEHQATQDTLATDDPNRIVCKKEHVIGSQFRKKVCRTVAEIKQQQQEAKEASYKTGGSASTGAFE